MNKADRWKYLPCFKLHSWHFATMQEVRADGLYTEERSLLTICGREGLVCNATRNGFTVGFRFYSMYRGKSFRTCQPRPFTIRLIAYLQPFLSIMTSRTERFERQANTAPKSGSKLEEEEQEVIRFSPEEEAVCVFSLSPVEVEICVPI